MRQPYQPLSKCQQNLVAEQRQWKQAREYMLQASAIFVEYIDQYSVNMIVNNLARVWNESGDAALAAAMAQVLGWTTDKTEAWLQQWLEAQQRRAQSREAEGGEEGE